MLSAVLQNLLVAVIVTYCALGAFRQLVPRAGQTALYSWGWQRRAQLSYWLEHRRAKHWRRLGVWLRPQIVATSGCSSGAGCNKCGSC